jgi:hypothetical protein
MTITGPTEAYFEPDTEALDRADAIDEEYGRLMANEYHPHKTAMVADAISEMEMQDIVDIAEALRMGNLPGVGALVSEIVNRNARARALAAAQRVVR